MRLETKKYLYDINRAIALLIQFTANKTFADYRHAARARNDPPTSFPPPPSFPRRRESPTSRPRTEQRTHVIPSTSVIPAKAGIPNKPPAHGTTHPRHSRESGNLQQPAHAWNNGLSRLADE